MTTFFDAVQIVASTIYRIGVMFPFLWGIAFGLIIFRYLTSFSRLRR